MNYLVDTNIVSELRKGSRCHPNVSAWFASLAPDEIFLSVLVVGEIRTGIERIRRRDDQAAHALDRWLRELVRTHEQRILPIDLPVVEEWGRLNAPGRVSVVDGLLAATAKVHDLSLASRNVRDVVRTGVRVVNPFEPVTRSGVD